MALDDFMSDSGTDNQATDTSSSKSSSGSEEKGSSRDYVEISQEEFEEFLEELPWDFEHVNYEWTQEHIYEMYSEKKTKAIRIYSSIDKRSGSGRDKGSDAIRTVLLHKVEFPDGGSAWRPLRSEKRTNRIGTWRKNLRQKIENIIGSKDELKRCSECGRLMIIQRTKDESNKFWGCTGYYIQDASENAVCTNTEPID